MEKYLLETDIRVFYIEAKSFPDGIFAAHEALRAIVPFSKDRGYFGISRPENGQIVYKAATEEMEEGEAERLNLQAFTIPKGEYISKTIPDFAAEPQSIGRVFQELISQPDIDPQGYCIEWYLSASDVRCMVRLK